LKLPNGDKAIVTDDKLFRFLTNVDHETQPGHAILFRTLLGIDRDHAEKLRSALLRAAVDQEATEGQTSPFGTKHEIRFEMSGPRGTYTVLSVWMTLRDDDRPRLITAFIE